MHSHTWNITTAFLLATFYTSWLPLTSNTCSGQSDDLTKNEKLNALDGEWLYVKDRTEGRPVEKQGPPMSVKFSLRVEKDAVIYPRPRGDERITLDGSAIKKDNQNGSVTYYRGAWKDNALEYTLETIRTSDKTRVLVIKREFRITADGLQVHVCINDGTKQIALYRHPEEIALPSPAKATIADVDWIPGAWVGTRGTSSIEERWSPLKGGAILGVSRTTKGEKMVAFEFLRIVERDGGLVYIAQPGGRSPTEFILTEKGTKRAVFDNPRHDYPQRIVYVLSPEGKLTASIGFINGGTPRSFEFSREAK